MEENLAFKGTENMFGRLGFERLRDSHVMIIGVGGVGSWAAEALVRAGLSKITLVDADEICLTNLNRQIHTLYDNIGVPKVVAMKERLLKINPACSVFILETYLTAENCREILEHNPCDFILDAIDGLKEKCHLIATSKDLRRKLLVVGGAGNLFLPEKIQIKDLNHTFSDPLLMRVRKKLRSDFNFERGEDLEWGIPALFTGLKRAKIECVEESSKGANCNTGLGTMAAITGTFGFWAASFIAGEIARGEGEREDGFHTGKNS